MQMCEGKERARDGSWVLAWVRVGSCTRHWSEELNPGEGGLFGI